MAFRDLLSAAERYDDDDDEIIVDLGDLEPGERIAPPGSLSRGQRALRRLAIAGVLLGGAWGYMNAPEPLKAWLVAEAERLLTMELPPAIETATPLPQGASSTTSTGGVVEPPPAPEPIAEETEIAAVPGAAAGTLVSAEPAAPAPETTTPGATNEQPQSQPLPPPAVDASDPNQKRAASVGLHPGISKAVLGRLTDTDFKNAATAIKTALSETADGAVYTWPRNAGGAKVALFEVKFVEGAAPDCRRYVVIVTKDRWSTTAPPMEKCGVKGPDAAKAANTKVKAGPGDQAAGAGSRAAAGREG